MSEIKLITVTNHPEHAQTLIRSATKHGWDLEVINCEWKGFGTKLIATYEYLKAHPEVERFVFADAFDVVVFGTPEEFIKKNDAPTSIFLSAEKGLWPPILHPFSNRYSKKEHGFNYINSGLYYSPVENFFSIFEGNAPSYETDDQYWMNMVYLFGQYGMILDRPQVLFNSHSFISEGEYTYNNGRVQIMGNEPIFVHSNGKTIDPKLNEII